MNKSRVITVGSAAGRCSPSPQDVLGRQPPSITSADDIQRRPSTIDRVTDKINRDLSAAGSLAGAVYRVENLQNGGGGDATVACADTEKKSQKYTAIAGGVEAGHTGDERLRVSASFPGRMDWEHRHAEA